MERRQLLGALVPLGLSGCLRLSNGETEESEDVQTVTTTERPTETAAPDPTPEPTTDESSTAALEYPIGLSDDGVAPLLVDTSLGELGATTYTVAFRKENVTDGQRYQEWDAQVGEDGRLLQRERHSTDVYHTRERQWWRMSPQGNQLYGTNEIGFEDPYLRPELLKALFSTIDFETPETVSEAGTRLFRTESSGVADPEPDAEIVPRGDVETVDSVDAALRVTPDGVIRDFDVDLAYTDGGERKLLRVALSVTGVGSTSVPAPDWTETAAERAPELTVSLADDETYVTVTHEGGDTIPPGAGISFHDHGGGGADRDFGEPFESGESRYAWLSDGAVTIDDTEPSTGGTPLDNHTVELLHKTVTYDRVDLTRL
jgi:hypothetical protein